jgi:phenylacetate-CoA ligase
MQSLDRLRGYYVHAPAWVQSTGGRLLAKVPPRLLYGETFRRFEADIARSAWDAEFVEGRQRASLATLFALARGTRHYADLLDGVDGGSPSVADLSKLPILDKQQVRQGLNDMLARPRSEMDEVTTGGTSSGVPLVFYLDKNRSVKEWAFITHLWHRAGYELGDRLAVLGYRGVTHLSDVSAKPWSWEPGTRELRLSPFRMVPPVMDAYLEQIERFGIDFIYGYPSVITVLASHARNVGWPLPKGFKGILLMSESIRPFQRQIIAEGFGPVPVLAGYGLSEKVAIAGEMPDSPDEYEFEPLYGVTELVDPEGRPVTVPGEQGRLVGTGFVSMGMPLLRYDTGDLATAVALPSAENCWRLRVRDIVSRYSQEHLVTREGGLVTRVVFNLYSRVANEFQFVQHEPGVALMRVVPERGVDRRELETFVQGINRQTRGAIAIELEIVDELPRTARGKRKLIEQHLDLAQYGLAEG